MWMHVYQPSTANVILLCLIIFFCAPFAPLFTLIFLFFHFFQNLSPFLRNRFLILSRPFPWSLFTFFCVVYKKIELNKIKIKLHLWRFITKPRWQQSTMLKQKFLCANSANLCLALLYLTLFIIFILKTCHTWGSLWFYFRFD